MLNALLEKADAEKIRSDWHAGGCPTLTASNRNFATPEHIESLLRHDRHVTPFEADGILHQLKKAKQDKLQRDAGAERQERERAAREAQGPDPRFAMIEDGLREAASAEAFRNSDSGRLEKLIDLNERIAESLDRLVKR